MTEVSVSVGDVRTGALGEDEGQSTRALKDALTTRDEKALDTKQAVSASRFCA